MPARTASQHKGRAAVKADAVEGEPQSVAASPPAAAGGWVQYIGNATLLIRYGSLTILTDPNLVHRGAEVRLGFGLTTTRLTDPALDVDELPAPDLVILSHDHGDHFDAVAADWLPRETPIVTTPAAASALGERGFVDVRPLETWQSAELVRDRARVRVTAVPAQHGGGPIASAMPEVMGSLLELWEDAAVADATDHPADLRLYVSGDTVFHDALGEVRERFGDLDIAFLHLGGMKLVGMMVTMDAAQGVKLIDLLQPRLAIPVHYNDYGTSTSTLAEFVAAVNEAGLAERVRYLRHGDVWTLAGVRDGEAGPGGP